MLLGIADEEVRRLALALLLPNSTLPGSRIGRRKATSAVKASGRRGSSAARQRALVHIPCAIAAGKPSGFAVSECMWIGLRSPETAA